MSLRSYHLNAMFVMQRTSKTEEHDGGAARPRHTVRRSALQEDCEQTPGDCARMPVSRSAARDTRSCLPIRAQSRRPSPPYSPRWRVPSEPARWRDDGVSRRGVCFAAGWGLWGRRWRFSGRVYRGDLSPVVYGPVGISAAAMWRIKVASGQATAKASRTRDAVSITRAPSFKRRRRRVANSAAASACAFGSAARLAERNFQDMLENRLSG